MTHTLKSHAQLIETEPPFKIFQDPPVHIYSKVKY